MDCKEPDREGSSENSSNSSVSEAVIEVRSSETGCQVVEDGVSKEIHENPSNPAASDTVIDVRPEESAFVAGEAGDPKALEKSKVDKLKVSDVDMKKDSSVVVDVKSRDSRLDSGRLDGEKICRICHLSSDRRSDGWDLIQLGCGCKDDLGVAHRHCAEAWFKMKGNRCCEICGVTAKNVTGVEDNRFMEDWNDTRTSSIGSRRTTERGRCWRGQPFCNFLMACLVIAFILPWFFRVDMF